MAALTYSEPISARRPYKSFRFDVFSLKAGRRMTLYGKPALSQFIELEADFEVDAICERPLRIPDLKPVRLVDFWARLGGRDHYYLLLSSAATGQAAKQRPAMEDFRKWVRGENAVLHEVPLDLFDERRIHHANWATILQHLVAHRGQVTSALLERLAAELPSSFTLAQVESELADLDAMLVRAAIFTLLAKGSLRCAAIGKQHLHPLSTMERV